MAACCPVLSVLLKLSPSFFICDLIEFEGFGPLISLPARPRGVCQRRPRSALLRMEPLAVLLNEWPLQQLSATELRSCIALLEAELESRTTRLDALPDEIQQVIFSQLCNALDPRSAVDYSSGARGCVSPCNGLVRALASRRCSS